MKSLFFFKFFFILSLLFALLAPFTFQQINKPNKLIVEQIKVEQIKEAETPVIDIETPLHAVTLPDFAKIRDVKQKKRQFFNFIRPDIDKENQKLLNIRVEIKHWLEIVSLEQTLSEQQQSELNKLIESYKVNENFSLLQQLNELLIRIDIIPSPLVLVQAANESAWGTSRFARIGLNFFGLWCYRQGCGMVPNGRNHGAKHEVAAFNSVNHSVKRYLHNINTHNAYIVFRAIRGQLRAQNQALQPEVLATGLLSYSERGTAYVLEITEMIRHNRLYFLPGDVDAE